MNYGDPYYLSYVVIVAAILTAFYIWTLRRRKLLIEKFVDKNLVESMAPSASIGRKIFKMAAMSAAVSLGVFTLARPQWGFEWQEVKRTGVEILIAMDVSKSMAAKDMKPSRLERSKFAIKDLVKKLNGDRIGLIAFAGTSFLQCPLTIDYNGFLLALDDLTTDTIPYPGTSIGSAVKDALGVFKGPEQKYRALVVITDGEELSGSAVKEAQEAANAGLHIYCVGVGTQEGDLIPAIGEGGERGYLMDRLGNVVKTRLDEELLKKIALATGGSYVRATQGDFGLTRLYDEGIARLEKRDMESKMRKRYEERFQVFLAIAIALLLLEVLISDKKRTLGNRE